MFGKVYKGTEVVTFIESMQTDNFEKPLTDIVITGCRVIEYF